MNPPIWDQRIKKLAETVSGTRLITKDIIFDKVAVIVEPRILPITESLLTWMVYLLAPKGWKFMFYTGTTNHKIIHELVEKLGISDVVEIRNLYKENLTIQDYNWLLTSIHFWANMPYENVLIFQTDTVLLDGDLDKFLEYDYVGAPWDRNFSWLHNPETDVVGNGGLSLRKRSGMLRAINNVPYNDINEDRYFCINCKDVLNIAPVELAIQFSVESVFYSNLKGYHKCWDYIGDKMIEVYKHLDKLI